MLVWTRLALAFTDTPPEHSLAGIFFPEIIACINMKYLWVTSEKPSLSWLFIWKCRGCERCQAGQAPLLFPQALDLCLTFSVALVPLLASLQKQEQNTIVGSWKQFPPLLYYWKHLLKAKGKLLLGACWWSFQKEAGQHNPVIPK